MLYVPFTYFSITTSVFLLSSLVDPVLSRLYKSVLLKESTQCPDESRTSDPGSPLSKWKIKKILIKCRTDWKNYRRTRSGYIPRSSRPYCGNIFFLMLIFLKIKRIKDTTSKVYVSVVRYCFRLILSFLTKKWKNKTRRKNYQTGTQLPVIKYILPVIYCIYYKTLSRNHNYAASYEVYTEGFF